MGGRRWTEDDDIYLEYFAYEGEERVQEAADFLNRTRAATIIRLSKLRERNNDVQFIRRKWTEREDDFLRKNYITMSNKMLAESLRRTSAAIDQRKAKLGLRVNKPITVHKDKIIELINQGYYRPEIAKELGINEGSLVKFLIINNIYCEPVPYGKRAKKIRKLNLNSSKKY